MTDTNTHAITDAELQGMTLQGLNMAKREMEQKGALGLLFAMYFEFRGLVRAVQFEELLAEQMGEHWLDSPHSKTFGFALLRGIVQLLEPGAAVLATPFNFYEPTAKMAELDADARIAINHGPEEHRQQAVRDGLMEVKDGILGLAQTRQRVCIYKQMYADGELAGTPEVMFCNQENFTGNMKLFA